MKLSGTYLTVDECADILGLNASRVRQYLNEGRMPSAVNFDGRWLIKTPIVVLDLKPGFKYQRKIKMTKEKTA